MARLEINHNFTQEVLIPESGEFEEVTVHVTCKCEEIRRQPDCGIMRDYLELESVDINSIYLDGKLLMDSKVQTTIENFIAADFSEIQDRINEEN